MKNEMTDKELIARLRERGGRISTAAADRIEALVKERREDALELLAAHGQAQDAYEAQLKAELRRVDAEAEVEKLQRDLNDTTAVAENYTNLVRCKGGRIRNAGNSGYVCFICGADTSIGEKCRAALTETATTEEHG